MKTCIERYHDDSSNDLSYNGWFAYTMARLIMDSTTVSSPNDCLPNHH